MIIPNALKLGVVVSAPIIVGALGGGKLADALKLAGGARVGVQLGVGVVVYVLAVNIVR